MTVYACWVVVNPSSRVPDFFFSQWIPALLASDLKTRKLPSPLIMRSWFLLPLGMLCSFNHLHNSLRVSTPHPLSLPLITVSASARILSVKWCPVFYIVSESYHPHYSFELSYVMASPTIPLPAERYHQGHSQEMLVPPHWHMPSFSKQSVCLQTFLCDTGAMGFLQYGTSTPVCPFLWYCLSISSLPPAMAFWHFYLTKNGPQLFPCF